MQIKIIRISDKVVTCELEGGTLIDIAQKWFSQDVKENDEIDIDIIEASRKK